jgi:hypothetical protein
MPLFVAFAAFLLILFGHRFGLPIGPWVGSLGALGGTRKSPGQKSGVRTPALEMVLNHDSGSMEGRCLKGRFVGKALSSLNRDQLLQFLRELRNSDSQGTLLMEAYLDRRYRDWRDRESEEAAGDPPRRPSARGGMTINEAYSVLGLKGGAKNEEIRAAHRSLMMKFHPDQGGTTYFAARLNEAKDVLLAGK